LAAVQNPLKTTIADPGDLTMLREVFSGTGAPLGWDAVSAFEAAHGITLPEPYRSFTALISDGAPDGPPDYGLVRLGDLPPDWGSGHPARVLAEPFPLTAAWFWEQDPRPEHEHEHVLDAVFDHGSVVLGTDGCGMDWHLIVAGEHRGHIWNVTGEGAAPFGGPFGYTTAQPGFAGWVRHWADGKEWWDVTG
jgi:hypothetical protein